MAGTMPHAIFVETGLDGGSTVAAYAAELPGCATFAADGAEAGAAQDIALVRSIGGEATSSTGDPIDRLYAARDELVAALDAGGPSADGARRALRLAIVDDLRLAERLRGEAG